MERIAGAMKPKGVKWLGSEDYQVDHVQSRQDQL